MSQVTRSVLRGILEPDPRMEFWDSQSGEYNSGGTRLAALPTGGNLPGVPEPAQDTEMVLQASGSQSRNQELRIQTQTGGFADRLGASFVWKYNGDPATGWRGWDAPTLLTGWEPVEWSDADEWRYPHAVTLTDDTVVMVLQKGAAGGSVYLYTYTRDPEDGSFTSSLLISLGTQNQDSQPCLCVLPSGRVLLYTWVEDTDAESSNVRMYFSDDDGGTWSLGSYAVLPESVSTVSGATGYDTGRLRAAYKDGQVLLVASITSNDTTEQCQDVLVQFASSDLGSNFVEVDRTDKEVAPTQGGNYQDLVVVDGYFILTYLDLTSASPVSVRLASAYTSFVASGEAIEADAGTEAWGTLDGSSKYFTAGDLACWRDEAGHVYLTGRQPTVGQQWVVLRSIDAGQTWEKLARSSMTGGAGKWWDASDTSTYPSGACAVWQRARALIIHGHASNPSTYSQSISISYLGGYSTVTMPSYEAIRDQRLQVTWSTTYLPFDLPSDVGWTKTTTGAPTEDLSAGQLVTTVTTTQAISYAQTPSGTVDHGIIATVIVAVPSGRADFRVRLGNATHGYEVEVRITDTTVSAYDVVALGGTIIGSAATYAGSAVQVLVAMIGDQVTVWYRVYSATHDRVWVEVAQTAVLTDDAGATFTTNRVRFGTATGGAATRTHTWRMVAFVTDEASATNYVGTNIFNQENPGELFGRPYASEPLYVDDGVLVKAVDGPTVRGDQWDINTRYTYDPSHLLPQVTPSRRRVWRSAPITELNASTAWIHLAWRLDTDGDGSYLSEDSLLLNDLIALYLDGAKCADLRIGLWYDGAWHEVATTSIEQFAGNRVGNVLRPAGSSATGGKWRVDEAAGCGIGFYDAGYTAAAWTGSITSNTEGITNPDSATARRARFLLADPDSASSTSPYVGIWPSRHLIIIHPSGYDSAIRGVRVRIPVTSAAGYPGRPASGFYEIAKVCFGPVHVPGQDWSWDRAITTSPNVETSTAADGSRRTRVLGPTTRTIEVNWADGIDMSGQRSAANPDYLKGSANTSAEPVAFAYDVPEKLGDLVSHLDGSDRIVCYIPRIEYDSSSTSSGDYDQDYADRARGVIYGRITSPVRIEQVLGEDYESEIYRVTTIEFSEEP